MKIKLTSQGLLNFSRYVLKDILLQIVMRKGLFLNMVDHAEKKNWFFIIVNQSSISMLINMSKIHMLFVV